MAFQKPTPEVPKCPNCDAQLVADSKRENMYKCPNWKPHDEGCKGTIWFMPDGKPRFSSTGNAKPAFVNGNTMLTDEIVAMRKEMNTRLDSMAEYLVKKLGPVEDEK